MFSNLIESTSHQRELARRARFLIATLVGYALVVMCAGVVSIYAYDAQLADPNLELLVLVAPVDAPVEATVERNLSRTNASTSNDTRVSERTEAIAPISDSTRNPDAISSTPSRTPEIPPGRFVITNRNIDGGGPNRNLTPGTGDGGNRSGGPMVNPDEIGPPPSIKKEPKNNVVISKGVINGQAVSKPRPAYPPLALKARVQGTVSVQILVDEKGKVISARAYSGHLLLRQAAEQAALQSRFSPTYLSEVPVKVSGTITFNFVLN
jgi:TonB family protein